MALQSSLNCSFIGEHLLFVEYKTKTKFGPDQFSRFDRQAKDIFE